VIRLFAAVEIPEPVRAGLAALAGGVPGARWSDIENLHLTLRFIGEVSEHDAESIDDALTGVRAQPFTLALKGVGHFGGRDPRALWAGVESDEALVRLQRKIESALQRAGLAPETRKFSPHVTLARLRAAPGAKVMAFLARHALYASAAFPVDGFVLFSSELKHTGSVYRAERSYPLFR